MIYVYMDSGTSNTRAFLVKNGEFVDMVKRSTGTKDSAISGSNEILLKALHSAYLELLERGGLSEADVDSVWMSGMVTNTFGIVEIPHMTIPIDAKKMYKETAKYYEGRFFKRELCLVRGAKTISDEELVNFDRIDTVNNVRGEEIEVIGIAGSGLVEEDAFVVVSPGSHTHVLYVKNGALTDIVSNFTGELNHAIGASTILSGELAHGEVIMQEEYVKKGYDYLRKYGFCRALYIVHATRVFDVCPDAVRAQLMAGIISGSVTEMIQKTIREKWTNTRRIVIIGGGAYVESYRILIKDALPDIPVEILKSSGSKSFAYMGFLELIKQISPQSE